MVEGRRRGRRAVHGARKNLEHEQGERYCSNEAHGDDAGTPGLGSGYWSRQDLVQATTRRSCVDGWHPETVDGIGSSYENLDSHCHGVCPFEKRAPFASDGDSDLVTSGGKSSTARRTLFPARR